MIFTRCVLRKAAHQSSAIAFMDDAVYLGIPADGLHTGLKAAEEFLA
jgi:hypothetical protein